MKTHKNLKGSAILWSVCTLLIFMVIVSAVIVLSKFYYNRELTVYSEKRAEYIAKSGADIIANEIMNEHGINSSGDILDNPGIVSESIPAVLDLTLDNGKNCKVTIKKISKGKLSIMSEATNADSNAVVACCVSAVPVGYIKKEGSYIWQYKWSFDGYYTN